MIGCFGGLGVELTAAGGDWVSRAVGSSSRIYFSIKHPGKSIIVLLMTQYKGISVKGVGKGGHFPWIFTQSLENLPNFKNYFVFRS